MNERGESTAPTASPLFELQQEILRKKMEVIWREHDVSGAWKGERLGRDLAAGMRNRSWERDAEGQLEISSEDERSHIVFIHMGELDRLNTLGGHQSGDRGLELTFEKIQRIAKQGLVGEPNAAFDVYRYAGNDFVLNLRDVDGDRAEEIRRTLADEVIDISGLHPGEDPLPLAVSRVTRADGIAVMNALDEHPEDAGLTDQRVLISAMLDKAQILNDIEKVEMRVQRMVSAIESGQGEQAARDLYDKFLRKSLGDVFKDQDAEHFLEYEAFRQLVTDKGALQRSSEWTHLVTECAMADAFNALKARRAVGRSIELNIAKKIAEEALGRTEEFGSIITEEEAPISTQEFQKPEPTSGKREIARLLAEALRRKQESSPDPLEQATAELAQVDYELERAKRDERTGLYNRGMYFETMEHALAETKPIATVAIDMAFLKYFDKEGGPATGNLAIEKAAELLDRTAKHFRDAGVTVEAYRLGGDEFGLTVVGGSDEVVKDILDHLRREERSSGRIPATAGANNRYRPERLQFNYGLRSTPSAEEFRKELGKAGIPLTKQGTAWEQNELAEYLLRLADMEIEIHKGVNRMAMLMSRTLEEEEHGESGNVDLLSAYSQKAIFGKEGMQKIAECVARMKAAEGPDEREKTSRAINVEFLAFVIDHIDAKNRQSEKFQQSLDRRLEDAVRIRYFEQRIDELEEEVRILRMRLGESHEHITAAEQERDAIIQLRDRVHGRAPSSGGSPLVRPAA